MLNFLKLQNLKSNFLLENTFLVYKQLPGLWHWEYDLRWWRQDSQTLFTFKIMQHLVILKNAVIQTNALVLPNSKDFF